MTALSARHIGATIEITILIRCRDEAPHLAATLDAVLAQRDAPAFEVLALDSGSRDDTLELLASYSVRIESLPAGDFSFGRALNVGTAIACTPIVAYLSAHCAPLSANWLAALVAPFRDPGVIATFGRQVPVRGMNPIEAITQRRLFPPVPPAGVLFSNANAAVRREAVLTRPFDEDIPAAEDHLWARGARALERIVYEPRAAVAHSHPMTAREWRFRFYINGLASEYARRRYGVELPWSADTLRHVLLGRAGAFARLAGTLARRGEVRALAHLPSYAVARTLWYARGVREGARRYGSGAAA